MAAPVPKSVAVEILDALAPMLYSDADAPQNNALAIYINALSEPTLQEIEDYASDDPNTGAIGYSMLVDIERCPDKALPWLAQFVGVQLAGGLTPTEQRQQITDLANLNRGTAAAMAASIAPYLSGTKVVIFRERYGGAYRITVVTYVSQTDGADLPITNAIVNGEFETDVSDWTAYSVAGGGTTPTLTRDTGTIPNPYFSGACMLVQAQNFTGSPVHEYFWATTPGTYAPGDKIYCRIPFYGDGGWGIAVRLVDGPSTGAIVDVVDQPSYFSYPEGMVGDSVPLCEAIFTVPAGTTQIQLGMHHNVSAGATRFARVDNVMMVKSSKRTPYTKTSRVAGEGHILAALLTQKPGGLVLTYNVLDGQDYQLLLTNHATYTLIYSSYMTYNGIVNDAPGA